MEQRASPVDAYGPLVRESVMGPYMRGPVIRLIRTTSDLPDPVWLGRNSSKNTPGRYPGHHGSTDGKLLRCMQGPQRQFEKKAIGGPHVPWHSGQFRRLSHKKVRGLVGYQAEPFLHILQCPCQMEHNMTRALREGGTISCNVDRKDHPTVHAFMGTRTGDW